MVPTYTLNNGKAFPAIGLGCFMGQPGGGDETIKMVKYALEIGYRHLDTANFYGNEDAVGKGIRDSGVPREELFVVTKLSGRDHGNVEAAFNTSLKNLDLEYLDLYLMHWPQAEDPETGRALQPDEHPNFVETWQQMEKLLEGGKVKSIGVSNFSTKNLDILLPEAKVVPAVNQIEVHPLLPQFDILEYCKAKGIIVTAYSPFAMGQSDLVQHPLLKEIGARTGHTTTQVVMGWFFKKGIAAIPKSANPKRLQENLKYVEISAEDEARIDAIHEEPGMHRTAWTDFCVNGTVFGWTYEQLGWPFEDGGHVVARK